MLKHHVAPFYMLGLLSAPGSLPSKSLCSLEFSKPEIKLCSCLCRPLWSCSLQPSCLEAPGISRRSSASGSFTRNSSFSVGGGVYVGHDSEATAPLDHTLHRRKLSVSLTAVMTVRAKLDTEEQLSTSNDTIHRFLRATGGDPDLVGPLTYTSFERKTRCTCCQSTLVQDVQFKELVQAVYRKLD